MLVAGMDMPKRALGGCTYPLEHGRLPPLQIAFLERGNLFVSTYILTKTGYNLRWRQGGADIYLQVLPYGEDLC